MKNQFTSRFQNYVYFILILGFCFSCKTNKFTKAENNPNAIAILDSLNAQNQYYIDINVAYPFMTAATSSATNYLMRNTGNTGNRIDVSGDGNYIRIQNDSVKGYLPFFGERRLNSGAYNGTDVSIQFEQQLEDLTKEIDTRKGNLELNFSAYQKGNGSEKYDITVYIFPNKKVSVDIRPLFRTIMRYDGELANFDAKD